MGWKESADSFAMSNTVHSPHSRGGTLLCMPQFKIGDRIRIIKPDIDHECRKGEISAVEPSEELDRMEMRDEKFAQFRGYTVKLDTGHTKLYIAMDIEADVRTTGGNLRLQIL
jgi:hypothetical protein